MRSTIPNSLLESYTMYLFETHRRFEAYEPLLEKAVRSASKDYIATGMLRLSAIVTRLTLLGVLIAQECSWDKFLPNFEEIRAYRAIFGRPTHDGCSALARAVCWHRGRNAPNAGRIPVPTS
jgi:hypothetical protein